MYVLFFSALFLSVATIRAQGVRTSYGARPQQPDGGVQFGEEAYIYTYDMA